MKSPRLPYRRTVRRHVLRQSRGLGRRAVPLPSRLWPRVLHDWCDRRPWPHAVVRDYRRVTLLARLSEHSTILPASRFSFDAASGKWTDPTPFTVSGPSSPSGSGRRLNARELQLIAPAPDMTSTAQAWTDGYWNSGVLPSLDSFNPSCVCTHSSHAPAPACLPAHRSLGRRSSDLRDCSRHPQRSPVPWCCAFRHSGGLCGGHLLDDPGWVLGRCVPGRRLC